jgi:hypothetical protein
MSDSLVIAYRGGFLPHLSILQGTSPGQGEKGEDTTVGDDRTIWYRLCKHF